ncbi:hypothetical protein NBRC10512_002672 [Rhodotorula toruloides]|uniref:Uncharacterized protein n=1 Tax=Rhodotorula toruloides (strain NP11) TaxID=1130832 RepID=M7X365_RHOT1|nr:uncharacterized protein RHTO_04921 [Rhodotorula toruloides NP11]EMS24741.1 hypothetical protein RHTO_04921 [Rhodotorula toruloides NP11]
MQGERGWFDRPFSPADSLLSVVPDSQSPEPVERPAKRRKDFDEGFRVPLVPQSRSYPYRPTAPSPLASSASSTTLEQLSIRSVPKSEAKDEDDWSGGSTSYDEATTSSRARAPSPDDKERIKREIKAELAEEEERALLYRSRVNAARVKPDRRKERAPSLENRLKKEEPADDDDSLSFLSTSDGDSRASPAAPYFFDDDRAASATPSVAGTSRSTLFLEDEQPSREYGIEGAETAPRKYVERDYSTSEEEEEATQGQLSSDSDEYEPSELTEGTPMPMDDDDASTIGTDEGAAGRRRNGLIKRQPKKRKKVRQKAKTKKQVEADALNFLEGMDLPAPSYRPLDVKARLANELAKATAEFPRQGRVDSVELPPRRPPSESEDDAVKDSQDAISRSASRASNGTDALARNGQSLSGGVNGGVGRQTSPADSLEEYVDEQEDPETVFQPKFEDIDLLQNQAYFEHPTRQGAVGRWITLLEKDSEPLPPAFSYPLVTADCATLEALGIVVAQDLVLSRDFQDDSAEVLISHGPSAGVCALLWRDLTDSTHAERHQAAAGEGRRCCCPLWVPPNRREWDEESAVLERKYEISAGELGEVLNVAFRRRENTVALEDDDLLKLIYQNNWVWYSQIVQLGLTRRAYSSVTSRSISDALLDYQSQMSEVFQQERRRLQRRRDQEAHAARERGGLPNIEFHQDLLAVYGLENLEALRKRLDSAREADRAAGDEVDDDDAASVATFATDGPARAAQAFGNVDDWREKRFDPVRLNTPQGWNLVEAYRARDRAAGKA